MTTATKIGRVVAYNEDIPSKKSQDLLAMWSCKIT